MIRKHNPRGEGGPFRRRFLIGGGSLLLSALVAGWLPLPGQTPEPIKIGVYCGLTGSKQEYGEGIREGAELAVEEINAAGGVSGRKLELLVRDDQSTPAGVLSALTQLVKEQGVRLIVGESISSLSIVGAGFCQEAGALMITPSATNPEVTRKGDLIFRACFIDPFQGVVMANYAWNDLSLRRVAVMTDVLNDYSIGLTQEFVAALEKLGGKIVAREKYKEKDIRFGTQLLAVQKANAQGLFIPGYDVEIGYIAQFMQAMNLKFQLLGSDTWDSPQLLQVAGAAAEGAYYTTNYAREFASERSQAFQAAYRKKFQKAVTVSDAPAAYDAVHLLARAIERAGSADPQRVKGALQRVKGYQGATGTITLDANRNAVKSAFIYQIKGGQPRFVKEVAP